MQWAKQTQRGFTIVELLVVIVVIAILAAITIVAYNGIQNRAKQSAAQAAAKQAATKIQLYAVQNADQFPVDAETAGLSTAGSVYQWRVNNTSLPRTYCVTVTTQGLSYFVSQENPTPAAGACPGHGVNGGEVVTNLTSNPGSEVDSLSPYGSATVVRSTAEYRTGQASTCLIKTANASYVNFARGGDLPAGDGIEYRVRFWVKSSVSNLLVARRSPGGSSTFGTVSRTVTPNVWTVVDAQIGVPTGSTSFMLQVGWEANSTPEGSTLCVDDTIITAGTTSYQYADGNSPGWLWNGAPNNSSSTGPVQ